CVERFLKQDAGPARDGVDYVIGLMKEENIGGKRVQTEEEALKYKAGSIAERCEKKTGQDHSFCMPYAANRVGHIENAVNAMLVITDDTPNLAPDCHRGE